MSLDQVREYLKAEPFNSVYYDGDYKKPLGGDTFDSFHPATEEKLHSFARGMKADVDAAVEAAKVAWANGTGEWAQKTATERGAYVKKMCEGILANQEMLAQIESADTGKTYADAFAGIGGAAGEGEHWADLGAVLDAEQDQPQPTSIDGSTADGFRVVMRRDPIGIVGLISAWNYPLNVAFRKVAPALVAGNCAILKPSELAGLTCMFLGKLATDAGIPPGVFSVIPGDRDAGAALAANPAVMAISFTGSSATGSAIIENTAERVGATFLELGGKSALVVFDDVDTDAAVKTVMNGLLTNGGQICTAHSRLIVHKNMAPKLLPALKDALEQVEFATSPLEDVEALPGWDNMWNGKLQAVVSEGQFTKIKGFLADAKASGANFLTGGDTPLSKGYFFSPTVITGVGIDDDVWQKEVFGPVLVVREFEGETDAVAEANSTPYGLASTVLSGDLSKAARVANGIRAGAVYATDTGDGILNEFPNVPRGGFGCSGLGRELGIGGLHEYTELKSVNYTGSFSKL